MQDANVLRRSILDLFARDPAPCTVHDIVTQLRTRPSERAALRGVLGRMVSEGTIQRIALGVYAPLHEPHTAHGKKFDGDKPRWSLIPRGVIPTIIKVLEFGARKYGSDNWQKVPEARRRYYDAAQRHLEAWWGGERLDPETNLPHLAHASCCLLFLLWFDLQPAANLD